MSIGTKIKKIREFKNYTQEYMADQLGMSQTGYSKIERDEVELGFARLEQIAKILDLKVEDITSFDDKYIFNNYHNQTINGFVTHGLAAHERKLYEDQIELLRDKVKYLEEIIATLKP